MKEGGLATAKRQPIAWESDPDFFNEEALNAELERVFDVCHGCRRCVSLCQSFPTLFDLIDESTTMEVDGVAKADYGKVVSECFLCDLCFEVKCPYVPPHEWNIDFPHLMLRAKMIKYRKEGPTTRDKVLTSTDKVGMLATIPVVSTVVNAVNKTKPFRIIMEKTLGVHRDATILEYHKWDKKVNLGDDSVVLFSGCYANYNNPSLAQDLVDVYERNGIGIKLLEKEQCCGMPKLELGDIKSVKKTKDSIMEYLTPELERGAAVVSPVPSCVLMMRKEWQLLFPNDKRLELLATLVFDPCEYLLQKDKNKKLSKEFRNTLGKVSYHVACHQRVQNIGHTTRKLLELVPGTEVTLIERCSGHDGTYGVKLETYDNSIKLVKPLVDFVNNCNPDYFCSDCSLAGGHITANLNKKMINYHPLSLLKIAYGI